MNKIELVELLIICNIYGRQEVSVYFWRKGNGRVRYKVYEDITGRSFKRLCSVLAGYHMSEIFVDETGISLDFDLTNIIRY